MAKISDIIKKAKGEVGYTENPPNSNKTKYGKWYGMDGQPYCCIFIMWLFGDDRPFPKTASCTTLMNFFKKNGKLKLTPMFGDLVFLNFDKNPDKSVAKHIGIVVEVHDQYVRTIEGNTSSDEKGSQDNGGVVAYKKRYLGKNICGFGRVDYSDGQQYPLLKRGSRGSDVIFLQQRLATSGYSVGKIDGIFGGNTEKAVREFQHEAFPNDPKEWDGQVGNKTWKALLKGDK